jgi:DNA-binding NarL/FixJ family response regulator
VLPLLAWQELSIDRRAARLARYEEALRLRAQGMTFKAIGRVMDLDQRTVSRGTVRLAMAQAFAAAS